MDCAHEETSIIIRSVAPKQAAPDEPDTYVLLVECHGCGYRAWEPAVNEPAPESP